MKRYTEVITITPCSPFTLPIFHKYATASRAFRGFLLANLPATENCPV